MKFIPVGQEDPIVTFCRMVVDTKYEDLPSHVVNRAKQSILDITGVMIGGSAMEGIRPVVDLVKDKGGKPESTILFYGGKVPASEAALAIGPMSRAMDFAEIHPEGFHCTEHTVPALLAATGLKDRVTGKEFITAFVVGQEIMLRIGIAFNPSKAWTFGMTTGHYIFGSIAAVGRLIGLSQEELENAEGIGREMTQPHDTAMLRPATLMLKVHQGFIAQDAINACLLARRGVTGPRHEVLVGPRGYLTFPKWETDPSRLTKGLGEEWEMLNVAMKPYIGCESAHTSIYGIIDQMKEHNFTVDDIAAIEIAQPPVSWQLACTPWEEKMNPQTGYEYQFSLPYLVATAAYDKDVFLTSFTPEAKARQGVRELMARISAKEDTSLPAWATRLITTLKGGSRYSKEYFSADVKGNPQNPFTEQELIAKFKKCVPYSACKLSDATVDSLVETILNLEKVDDVVSAIIIPLTPM